MNETRHIAGFPCKNAWARQPQNEVPFLPWDSPAEGDKRDPWSQEKPHKDLSFTPTGRHKPRPSPCQTHKRWLNFLLLFISYCLILLALHFPSQPLISFPIAVHLPLSGYKQQQCSVLSYPDNHQIKAHKYTHITEFTYHLHTTEIYFMELHRC